MPPDPHVNLAEEPPSTSTPGRPEDPAPGDTTFMMGVLREPTSRVRVLSQVMRIGRRPDNDLIIFDPGVSEQHAELRRTPAGRYLIIDVGSRNGTYVNGTRVSRQELKEGDIIAIGPATFRLADGELTEYLAGSALVQLHRTEPADGTQPSCGGTS
jgi:pSer/pThr/pTyr-binding forkhead associated (FHA) protein